MLTWSSYTEKNNQKAARISTIQVLFFAFLIALLFVEKSMADDFIAYKGYCKAEHEFDSGRRVGITKTSILRIRWMLEDNRSQITHVRFCDLVVTNLKTGSAVNKEKIFSPDMPIGLLSPLADYEGRLDGVVWKIDKNEAPVKQMQEFVDFRVSGIAVELIDKKEINRKKFEIFLMRDYKSVPAAALEGVDNWTVGPYAMISKDGTPVVLLEDSTYDRNLGQILTTKNYGKLRIADGDIVFDEIVDKREVYYNIMIDEEYKEVDGILRRFWDYKRKNVDSRPYAYKTIYQRGYSDK
jgi:hypothetical protein